MLGICSISSSFVSIVALYVFLDFIYTTCLTIKQPLNNTINTNNAGTVTERVSCIELEAFPKRR